jgi:hypothetical protein
MPAREAGIYALVIGVTVSSSPEAQKKYAPMIEEGL